MITSITPIGEFSVGKLVEKKKEGDIALPDSASVDTYDEVKVIAVGNGVVWGTTFYDVKFEPGDTVLVYKGRNDKIKIEGGEVVIFRSIDAVAVVGREE